jgi:hypothetical protein
MNIKDERLLKYILDTGERRRIMLKKLKKNMFELKSIPVQASEAYDEQSENILFKNNHDKIMEKRRLEKLAQQAKLLDFDLNKNKTLTNLNKG